MSNFFTDDIKTCNNVGLMMVWAEICLFMVFVFSFTSFFKVFINIREYANEIIYISDHRKKGKCLSFNVVPYLMLYDKNQFYTWLIV